jgi:hypothetical protein
MDNNDSNKPRRTIKNRGLASKILECMLNQQGGAVTVGAMAKRFGVPENIAMGSMAHLATKGQIHRLGMGIYQVNPALLKGFTDGTDEWAPAPEPAQAESNGHAEADDLITNLLDKMFPHGVSTAQWKRVSEWIDATEALIEEAGA